MIFEIYGICFDSFTLDSQLTGVSTNERRDHSGQFHVKRIIDVNIHSDGKLSILADLFDDDLRLYKNQVKAVMTEDVKILRTDAGDEIALVIGGNQEHTEILREITHS